MTEIAIETDWRPIAEWLPRENSMEIVDLTRGGRKRFVVVPLDEMDKEVLAIRKNACLMAYIGACSERARTGPTKSLVEIRAKFGIKDKAKSVGKRRSGKR